MTNIIELASPAKLNLCLDIIEKHSSGYHIIRTIIHEVPEISDTIKIYETKDADNLSIPKGTQKSAIQTMPQEKNLAFKALKLVKETFKINKCANIEITKNIPVSSGLGGASSNAATTLRALNVLWNLNLGQQELLIFAEKLGMDVPFFIIGGTALCTHFGEKVTPLPHLNLQFEVNAKTSLDPEKTKNAYSKIDLENCGKNTKMTKKLIKALEKQDKGEIIKNLHNDFEILYPVKKDDHLTGSGPSTFYF